MRWSVLVNCCCVGGGCCVVVVGGGGFLLSFVDDERPAMDATANSHALLFYDNRPLVASMMRERLRL